MTRRCILAIALAAGLCRAEILDRVAAFVGRQAITQSDVEREIRLSAFLNQTPPDLTAQSKHQAAERLVERALMASEFEVVQYTAPEPAEAAPALDSLKKEHFATEAAYREALARYKIDEAALTGYLLEQMQVDRFIRARFGAGVQVTESELLAAYTNRLLPQWENKESNSPRPSFDEARAGIEELLRQERADLLLDNWLSEAKGRTRIEFKEDALK